MRLTCPNCGAEYEVPDGLLPEGGKHVQCTDCDTRWFVRGGRDAVVSEDQLIERLEKWRPRLVTTGGAAASPTPAERAGTAPPPEPEPEPRPPEPERARDPEPSPTASETGGSAERVDAFPDLTDDGPPEDFVWEESRGPVTRPEPGRSTPEPPKPPPAPVPPAAAPMFQPVQAAKPVIAPSSPAGPVASTAGDRAAPETALPEAGTEDGEARPVRGRTRNSQRIELPEDGTRAAEVSGPPAERDRFLTGLLVAIAIFVLALGAYAARERLVSAMPSVEPALSGYAGAVDGLRERIDRIVTPDG